VLLFSHTVTRRMGTKYSFPVGLGQVTLAKRTSCDRGELFILPWLLIPCAGTEHPMLHSVTCKSCDLLCVLTHAFATRRWQADSLHLISSNLVNECSLSVPGLTPSQFCTEECIIRPQSCKVRVFTGTLCPSFSSCYIYFCMYVHVTERHLLMVGFIIYSLQLLLVRYHTHPCVCTFGELEKDRLCPHSCSTSEHDWFDVYRCAYHCAQCCGKC